MGGSTFWKISKKKFHRFVIITGVTKTKFKIWWKSFKNIENFSKILKIFQKYWKKFKILWKIIKIWLFSPQIFRGVPFLKFSRGAAFKICDNHRGYQNQIQNLMKIFPKYWKFFKNHPPPCAHVWVPQYIRIYQEKTMWKFPPGFMLYKPLTK